MDRAGDNRRLFFNVLGSVNLSIEETGERLDEALRHTRAIGVLAYLILDKPSGRKHRDQVATLFWPDVSQAKARHTLRQTVYLLRRLTNSHVFPPVGPHDLAVRAEMVRCDALEFEDLVNQRDVDRAVDLYRGPLLHGLVVPGCPDFDDWVEARRLEYANKARTVWKEAAKNMASVGDLSGATGLMRLCLDSAPYDEEAVRMLIDFHRRCGDSAAAVTEYRRLAERMKVDLQVSPSLETQSAVGALKVAMTEPARLENSPPMVSTRSPGVSDMEVVAGVPARNIRSLWKRIAVGLVSIVAMFAVFTIRDLRSSPTVELSSIAVLPFVVQDTSRSFLREGLMDLMAIRLNSIAGIAAVDSRSLLQAIGSTDSEFTSRFLLDVAHGVGANHVVLGRVITSDPGIHVVAQLFAASDTLELLEEAELGGTDAGLLIIVDGLVAQLLTNRYVEPVDRNRHIASATSRSPEALIHFLEGEQNFRSPAPDVLMEDRYAESEAFYRKAFEVDSAFAMAAYRLSQIRSLRGDHSGAKEWAIAARRLAANLPRHYRALMYAQNAYEDGRFADAEVFYRSVLEIRPNEIDAVLGLAEVLHHGNPLRGLPAIGIDSLFERAVQIGANGLEPSLHLAHLRYSTGDFEGGLQAARRALGDDATSHMILKELARDPHLAIAPLIQGASPVMSFLAGWNVAQYLVDLDAAQELLDDAFARGISGAWREEAVIVNASFDAARGRYRAAFDQLILGPPTADRVDLAAWLVSVTWFIQSLDVSNEIEALRGMLDDGASYSGVLARRWHIGSEGVIRDYLRASLNLNVGLTREADSVAQRLAMHSSADEYLDSLARDLSRVLVARDLWKMQGRPWDALDTLDRVNSLTVTSKSGSPFYSRDDVRLMRAEILRELGRLDDARRWYDSLERKGDPTLTYLMYRALVDYRLAEIHREQGDTSEALHRYERLLKQWADPDPALLPIKVMSEQRVRELRR